MQIAENETSAYFDSEASRYAKMAADFAKSADSAATPAERDIRLAKAMEYRELAIQSLESAKTAASSLLRS